MESIKEALLAEQLSGKVRPEKIYAILISLVDALQTPPREVVQPVSQEAPPPPEPVPEPEPVVAKEPEIPQVVQEPAPGPKMFGRSA